MTARSSMSVRGSSRTRLRWLLVLVTVVLSFFGARAFQLQGLDPKAYAARAAASGVVNVPLPATRGEITDRNGKPLAESVQGQMLIADPSQTKAHAGEIATVLARRLGIDYFDALSTLTKSDSKFAYLARRVPSTVATGILDDLATKKIKGLSVESDPLRTYPAKDVAANLVGFIYNDGKERAGLEGAFNKRLAGKDGQETYEIGDGNRIPLGKNSITKPVDGKGLQLTIDADLQWYAQSLLRNAVVGSRSDSGSVVVLDTKTADVLALADYPTFDANDPGAAKEADRGARSVQNVFEPGSVNKVLTFASLLDRGLITPTTDLSVPGELEVQDRTVHDWFDHPTLRLTAAGVLAKSSNIGTVLASRQISNRSLYDHLRSFGMGRPIGLGLPGETQGLLPDWRSWAPINRATISFGQGISTNTVQMAAAANTIANGGVYVSPSLIKGRATTDSGQRVGSAYATQHRVISAKAARETAEMMEMVPNPETGTAPGAQVPGYRVSGKTGTAQRVNVKCKCYDGTFTVSFVGFAPADKPRFTVYVVVQNPKNGGGGGSIGGPLFSKIQTYLLQHYGVAPTGTKPADLPIEW